MKLNGVYSAHKQAYEESVPDTEHDIDQEREAMAAGRSGLISAVADLTGIQVDHYAEVGLLGFVLLTDAVGGVDVCLQEPVDDPMSGAHFPGGTSTLMVATPWPSSVSATDYHVAISTVLCVSRRLWPP